MSAYFTTQARRDFTEFYSSDCLWATHFKFLNYSNEFFAAKKFILDFVFREIHRKMVAMKINGLIEVTEGQDLKELCRDEAERIVGIFYEALLRIAAPFIFSSFAL